ncbi:MAG: histidine kinase [Spirochaetes bacterium]|nr:MAG: histidine kinase [Spirochaetota bacterium]
MGKKSKRVRIFSALEAANICGVVNQTAINWIKGGHLKAFTTPGGQYRIYAEDLVDFLVSRNMKVPEELSDIVKWADVSEGVLIIDDDREFNNIVKDYFSRKLPEGKIYQAFDGFEAGKMMLKIKPAVVILDIDLPGVDGYKLCRQIKEDYSLGNPMVIAVTGLDDPSAHDKILSEGADAFFAKPVDLEELISFIVEKSNNYHGKEQNPE